MLLGHTLIPYPFSIENPPTCDEFLRVIQRAICSNINEELGDAERQIELLVEQSRAQQQILLQANAHMASQMQAMEERTRAYWSAVQSQSKELLEQAVISLKAPLLAIPRWDRTLQEAVRNRQYTLRPASRVRGRSKSRNRLAGGGQIPTTSERAEQAKRAQRRNTIVPATATTPAGQAPPAEQTEPQAASDASTKVGNDSGEDSDDLLESETGSPNVGKSGSESLTPFSRLFKETRESMDMA